jgi:membrane-bound lytic murein transglycosylase B
MQLLPATFAANARPVPPGGADPSPYDPVDAAHAAARYLCHTGARAGADIPAVAAAAGLPSG